MPRTPRPVSLVLTCVGMLLASIWLTVFASKFVRSNATADAQVIYLHLTGLIPNLIMWGCICWLTTRQGDVSWQTWVTPACLILAAHIPEFGAHAVNLLYGLPLSYFMFAAFFAVLQTSGAFIGLFVLSRSLQIFLFRSDAHNPAQAIRLTIGNLVFVGTIVVFLATSISWIVKKIGNSDDFMISATQIEINSLLTVFSSALADASVFTGVLWALKSTHRKWLGLVGPIVCVATLAAYYTYWYVFDLLEFEKENTTINTTVLVPHFLLVLGLQLISIAVKLLLIPLFRFYGYCFAIGSVPMH